MMLALGCVQSLVCNTNHWPTGITTQDKALIRGLDVTDKSARVARCQAETRHALLALISTPGLTSPAELTGSHIYRRVDQITVRRYDELFPMPAPGASLNPSPQDPLFERLRQADVQQFTPALVTAGSVH